MVKNDLLRMKLTRQRDEARRRATSELIHLRQRINQVIEQLDRQEPAEETVIQNGMGITHVLVQYNQALDVLPLLED